jgi:hypothetical protein
MMAVPLLFGPYGRGALEHVEQFAASGANACWFHGFDAAAFEVCERHGVAACVEFKTFRADFATSPELIPIGVDGRPIRYERLVQGVCLSKRAFVEQIGAALAEGLRDFRPVGIWLDYLTYGGWFETPEPDLQESCFCQECIAEFCAATGVDVASPQEILARHGAAWTRHKCERVAAFAARYAAMIRKKLPECVIGAYMCPWFPDEFDGALSRIFAQDYGLFAPSIDIFTPLIYCEKSGRAADWGRQFLDRAGEFVPQGRRVQLILDALDFPASIQETAAAAQPTWGLQLFGGTKVFGDREQARIFREAVERIRAAIAEAKS